jgi:hypothetical protein
MSVKQVTDSENFNKHNNLGLFEFFGDDTKVLSEKEHAGILRKIFCVAVTSVVSLYF